MPRAIWWSEGGGLFLVSEVNLWRLGFGAWGAGFGVHGQKFRVRGLTPVPGGKEGGRAGGREGGKGGGREGARGV